jgi:hypothetical protein
MSVMLKPSDIAGVIGTILDIATCSGVIGTILALTVPTVVANPEEYTAEYSHEEERLEHQA